MTGDPVKARGYTSSVRAQRAAATRQALLDAGRRLFVEQGYAVTTVAQIASAAEVNVDTLYASIGPKPVLFRLLLETAISGLDEAVPAEERDYVRRIRVTPGAGAKIDLYTAAVTTILGRTAPLYVVMGDAAGRAPELATMREEISQRRAANMHLFARDLFNTGELRTDLDLDEVADTIWATTAAEFYTLLVRERGWTPAHYETWLGHTWRRLFLPLH